MLIGWTKQTMLQDPPEQVDLKRNPMKQIVLDEGSSGTIKFYREEV